MKLKCPFENLLVIPAQAGIQLIEKFPRSGSTIFCPLCGVSFLLDSRLRGNDGIKDCPA